MNIPKRFEDSSFDNFIIRNEVYKELVEILKKDIKSNLIISGPVGCGKTHLAWALYNLTKEVREYRGVNFTVNDKVAITSAKEVLDLIRKEWKEKNGSDALYDLKNIPILVIDEVGVQYGSKSERIELFPLFDYRYNEMLPTIVLTNLKKDSEKNSIYEFLGQRICDRLFGDGLYFEIYGESMRGKDAG